MYKLHQSFPVYSMGDIFYFRPLYNVICVRFGGYKTSSCLNLLCRCHQRITLHPPSPIAPAENYTIASCILHVSTYLLYISNAQTQPNTEPIIRYRCDRFGTTVIKSPD